MKLVIDLSQLKMLEAKLAKEIDQFATDLMTNVRTEVTARTPIDTGRARRGWQSRTSAVSKSVVNNVPYIGALERGRSKQAPNGFVKQAMTAAVNKTKRIIK